MSKWVAPIRFQGEAKERTHPMSQHQAHHPRTAPPRYKLALLTWAGAYALITAILGLLGPAMATWPLPLKTLPISVLMVVALTWVVIPSLTRLFRGWLTSASSRPARVPARRESRMRLHPGNA
jgi:antibiotic biosynthesis monooxygenase (ABM) superfamily enzyme